MASTFSLQTTVTWAQQHVNLRPLNLGSGNEPAISSGNLVRQTILGPPFKWRWNRARTAFFTSPGVLDYVLLKWRLNAAVSVGWQLVDANGKSQIVTVAGTTGGSQPTWNTVVGGTTTDGGVTWKNQGVPGSLVPSTLVGDPGSICFIEHASVQSTAADSPASAWNPMDPKLKLDLDSTPGRPIFISAEGDDNAGDITFRLQPVPDQAYPVAMTLQQKSPLFAALSDKWAPIPDEFSYIYTWGFLALTYLYADDQRFSQANQKFVSALLGASQGLTATEVNVFLGNWMALTGQPMWMADRLQQGVQAQGV